VLHYLNSTNKSLTVTGKLFQVAKSTLGRWVKIFVKNKNSFPKIPRTRKTYKMTKSHTLFIKSELEQNPKLTIWGLTNKINNCFDKKISYSLVYSTLQQQGLRLKAIKKQKADVSNVYQKKKSCSRTKNFL
jgi:transposase